MVTSHTMKALILHHLLLLSPAALFVHSFGLVATPHSRNKQNDCRVSGITPITTTTATSLASHTSQNVPIPQPSIDTRRSLLQKTVTSASLLLATTTLLPVPTPAAVDTTTLPPEMKTFTDPMGLFSLSVPKRFYTLRRSAKGDLPDAKTGKGRRGSSIFTAGDMAKAEVVAVERFPTMVFLEDEGIVPSGDLSTFPALGNVEVVAKLLALRREKDKPGQSQTVLVPGSVSVSEDGKTLLFELRTRIDVQKPELLMEQMGVSELVRVTLARAELHSGDGQIMACFASSLQQDFEGADGVALRKTIESFSVGGM